MPTKKSATMSKWFWCFLLPVKKIKIYHNLSCEATQASISIVFEKVSSHVRFSHDKGHVKFCVLSFWIYSFPLWYIMFEKSKETSSFHLVLFVTPPVALWRHHLASTWKTLHKCCLIFLQGKKGIWLKLPLEQSDLVPIAVKVI